MMIRPRLERVRQQQELRLAEQLACQVKAGRRPFEEPVRQADDGMTRAIGQQQVRTDSRIRGCRESRRLAARFLFASEARATTQAWPARLLAEKVETASALMITNPFRVETQVVNLTDLKKVSAGDISPETLYSAGLIGKPDSKVKLLGTGEKMDALEDFHPSRIANRILGMGDIVSLVEKAAESIDAEKARRVAERMRKGKFDLDDLSDQLAQVEKIGGLGGIMGMLPGVAKMKEQLASARFDDGIIKRQRAIISSMTREERRAPDVLKASRKRRVAAGSGVRVEDVNKLLKLHRQMADMMKTMGGAKRGGAMGKMASMFGLPGGGMGGGMPQPTPEQLAALQRQVGQTQIGPTPGQPAQVKPGLRAPEPPKLPGLGGAQGPGLGGGLWSGLNPFGKKK
jgi:signal recognition particle subunit SRP54